MDDAHYQVLFFAYAGDMGRIKGGYAPLHFTTRLTT